MSEKKHTVCKLFVERITREGRLEEWKRTVADVQVETGQGFGQARWEAMRRMGYVSPGDERRRHERLQAAEEAEETAVVDQAAKETQARAELEFEEALNQLPTDADPKVEINWIRNHPAMARIRLCPRTTWPASSPSLPNLRRISVAAEWRNWFGLQT
ncbi:MAG: hypothetical protein JF612_02165 [Planctomycetia bacterium]|nr:hypothetical protein [Planctomycetia bacterium]